VRHSTSLTKTLSATYLPEPDFPVADGLARKMLRPNSSCDTGASVRVVWLKRRPGYYFLARQCPREVATTSPFTMRIFLASRAQVISSRTDGSMAVWESVCVLILPHWFPGSTRHVDWFSDRRCRGRPRLSARSGCEHQRLLQSVRSGVASVRRELADGGGCSQSAYGGIPLKTAPRAAANIAGSSCTTNGASR